MKTVSWEAMRKAELRVLKNNNNLNDCLHHNRSIRIIPGSATKNDCRLVASHDATRVEWQIYEPPLTAQLV